MAKGHEGSQMTVDRIIVWIQDFYAWMDKMEVSAGTLVALAALLALAGFLAVREASAWFFKVDELRHDIQRLHDLVMNLEGEIQRLHGLADTIQPTTIQPTRTQEAAPDAAALSASTAAQKRERDEEEGPSLLREPAPEHSSSASFPISH